MKKLRNLTLHPQGDPECKIAAEAGFELCRTPEGVEFGVGKDDLIAAAAVLAERLAECSVAGDAALIGGHTALWIVALDLLAQRGIARPALYFFSTLRKRDENGRFVFEPSGVETIPEFKSQV